MNNLPEEHINEVVTDDSVSGDVEDDWLFADATGSLDEDGLNSIPQHFTKAASLSSSRRVNSSSNLLPEPSIVLESMPSQLHPAVSLGVHRVSSCYFSLGSCQHESMVDLLSQFEDHEENTTTAATTTTTTARIIDTSSSSEEDTAASEVLYHDILMQVFTYLDASSLASFSETARRPNFEVFYYLQLQLQQALLVVSRSSHSDNESQQQRQSRNLSAIAGCASVTRLATLDMEMAQEVLKEYLNSNSTLRTMPLSYSLAYARQYLLHSGFANILFHNNNNGGDDDDENTTNRSLAKAALFMTVVGAASLVSTVSGGDAGTLMAAGADFSLGNELPNVLFRVGFVGSLMGAARQVSDKEHRAAMRETAENMAKSMQELPAKLRGGNQQRQDAEESKEDCEQDSSPSQFRLPSLFEMRHMLQTTLGNLAAKHQEQQQPELFPNPYDHLPVVHPKSEEEKSVDDDSSDNSDIQNSGLATEALASAHATESEQEEHDVPKDRKMPSGCVGAYYSAIHKASHRVMDVIKDRRKARFYALSKEEQRGLSLEYLRACSSNDSLERVKAMTEYMDVDGFFLPEDGTVTATCALHAAAFQGADRVIEFLCTGIDESNLELDGGLCDANCKDSNGWTALHFAAGANSVAAVQALVRYGANLQVEADNGYTPYAWASRLSNQEVANELMELIDKTGTNHRTWMSGQPLTSIANRFFALIPTHG